MTLGRIINKTQSKFDATKRLDMFNKVDWQSKTLKLNALQKAHRIVGAALSNAFDMVPLYLLKHSVTRDNKKLAAITQSQPTSPKSPRRAHANESSSSNSSRSAYCARTFDGDIPSFHQAH